MNVRVGSAPDSWGVWFASDPAQIVWTRFLDEVAEAGYRWIELGPRGYLPTDARLSDELTRRELRAAGTFVSFDLEDPEAWPEAQNEIVATCEVLRMVGAPHLILIDDMYTDLRTGELRRPRELDAAGWQQVVESTKRVIDVAAEYGVTVLLHPHADTHLERAHQIERLLDDVPDLSLCLDVGHFAYSDGSDPVKFFLDHHERIGHLHLKSVDPEVAARVRRERIPFARAVAAGMFVEPSDGIVDFVALRDALEKTAYTGFAIVEQDMYPTSFERPLPIARRTFAYFQEIGLA
jgi:inosose dehydratase